MEETMKSFSKHQSAKNRRRRNVLDRLRAQLQTGKKTTKEGQIDLTPEDISRIQSEIKTLESRI